MLAQKKHKKKKKEKMPPKGDSKTLNAKMQNAIRSFHELLDEFHTIFSTKPQLERLKTIFNEVETKYRLVKKQQETIFDKLVDEGVPEEDETTQANLKINSKVKADYLDAAQKFVVYEKQCCTKESEKSVGNTEPIEAMTAAVTKMAEALESKSKPTGGLERLTVPSWDGIRRTYATFKKEFNHWMEKYKQDHEEQLQRFRKAMPKGWWTDQVKTCKSIEQAWGILDVEFEDKRKLMDSLLSEINNLKPVKRDSKSLTMFSTTIRRYVDDMEDNKCSVKNSAESPFFMSQLLSKLDSRDNIEYGREMQRQKKEENVTTLVEWLLQEANFRSRGRRDDENVDRTDRNRRPIFPRRSDNHAINNTQTDEEICILGCATKHLLQGCPTFQASTVSQRWDIVKKNKRCRKCLRTHHTNDCSKADGTTCDKCKSNHHRFLHSEKKERPNNNLNPNAPPFSNPGAASENNAQNSTQGQATKEKTRAVGGLCPIQKVTVLDIEGKPFELLAMLDSGSNTSLLSKSAGEKLQLTGSKTHLTMNLAGGETKSEESELVEITITPTNEQSMRKTFSAYTVRKPCSSAKTVSKKLVEEYPHLKPISDKIYLSGGTVDLLIGTDSADAFIDIHTLSGRPGEPIAKRNCFGWYVLGQLDSTSSTATIQSVNIGTVSILDDIKKLLHQDQLGIKPTELCTCTDETLRESKFIKSLTATTALVNGRIQVKMPWKDTGPPKQSNYSIAYKRMQSSERNFNNRNCFNVVDEEVRKLVDQGFVTEVPADQIDHNKPEWYLPLQAVVTPDKSTKVRLVFDSSSKGHDGLSLNDHLEKGPNYINSLCDVLMAWRWDNVAYSGDIRKMFNQDLVHPDDQVYHRFLWRTSPHEAPTVYQWLRLNFGDKPAPDIATNAINTLAKSSEGQFPKAARELQEHAYVDDIGGSRQKVSEAKKVIEDIDTILGKGKFQVKAWHSNQKAIDQSDGEQSVDLLGHRWNKKTDKFTFKKREITSLHQSLTKRNCLALLAQLWDPIGLVSAVTVKFRIELQELWSSGFTWDEVLPDSIQQKWKENLEVMNHLLTFEYDRQLKPTNAVGSPEVHGFSDGGELAYGAVIFLRWKLEDGSYQCVPVMIKPFVAPLKKKSIPRLELLGCLALIRMYDTCTKALNFAKLVECRRAFWVDSSTVLSWVRTPPREFRPFVSARVAEIQEMVSVENFHYIRSKSNPADGLTRGIKPEHLKSWLEGPEFLQRPESQWPSFEEETENTGKDSCQASETKREKKTVKTAGKIAEDKKRAEVHSTTTDSSREEKDNPIFLHLMKSLATFQKVRRTLAFILCFVQKASKRSTHKGPLTVQELKDAEKQLFKWTQHKLDVRAIDKSIVAEKDEEGIIRAHGRLENVRALPSEMRNPIILPRDHPLVRLLILHLHNKRRHCVDTRA